MGYVILSNQIVFDAASGTGGLQDAINQAQTTKLPLFIKPGTYPTGDLTISGPVKIFATPGTVDLVSNSTSYAFTLNIRPNSVDARIADVTLDGLGFFAANLPFATEVDTTKRFVYSQFLRPLGTATAVKFNAVVSAYNVDNLRIERCKLSYSYCAGVALWTSKAIIRDCRIQNCRMAAIYSANNYATEIQDNFIHENNNNAIVVMRSQIGQDGTIVRGNQVYHTNADFGAGAGQVGGSGWYGNGFIALNANEIVVSNNLFFNSKFSGVRLGSCFNAQVTNNQILNSGETALMWEAPIPPPSGVYGDTNPNRFEGGVISGNTVIDFGDGINVTNGWHGGRRVTVTGNQVKTGVKRTIKTNDPDWPQYDTTGTGISVCSDCVVTGNIVEDCLSSCGILVGPGSYANGSPRKSAGVATGNLTRECKFGIGFTLDPNGYTLISNNIAEGSTSGAIVPVSLPPPYYTFVRVAGSSDYGTVNGGVVNAKPYATIMIGTNFAM